MARLLTHRTTTHAVAFTRLEHLVHRRTSSSGVHDAQPPTAGWAQDICGIIDKCTEAEIKSVADAMVSGNPSMRDLGYEYINMWVGFLWACKSPTPTVMLAAAQKGRLLERAVARRQRQLDG